MNRSLLAVPALVPMLWSAACGKSAPPAPAPAPAATIETGKPAAPEAGKPAAPEAGRPAAPEAGKPAAPEAAKAHAVIEVPPCGEGGLVLDKPLAYRNSSVKGDFRVVRTGDGGFAEAWKDLVVGRGKDFAERWRLDGWGRWVAPSPDGKRLALLAEGSCKVGLADATTGKILVESAARESACPAFVTWTGDGESLVVEVDDHLEVLDTKLAVVRKSPPVPDEDKWLGFRLAVPGSATELWVTNSNARVTYTFDAKTATFTAKAPGPENSYALDELAAAPDGSFAIGVADHDIHRLDPKTLAVVASRTEFGCRDVTSPATEPGKDPSTFAWHTTTAVSPDSQSVLAIDGSGQLFVFEPKELGVVARVSRDAANWVEDALWVDADTVAALTNDGRFVVVDVGFDGQPDKVAFQAKDLTD